MESSGQNGRAQSSVGQRRSITASAGVSPSATLPGRQWPSWRVNTSAGKRRFGGRCNSPYLTLVGKLELGERSVRRWAAGQWPVPTPVAMLLNLMLDTEVTEENLRS